MSASLFLIPTPLGAPASEALPPATVQVVRSLRDFAVENAKSARALLGALDMPCALRELNIREIGGDAVALLRLFHVGGGHHERQAAPDQVV